MTGLPHRLFMGAAALLLAAAPVAIFAQTTSPAPRIGPNGETLITVHLKDAFAEDVFSAVAKQAGVRFATQPDTLWDSLTENLSADFDQRPYWTVMQALCSRAGLWPSQTDGARRIILEKSVGGFANRPVFVTGPFLICIHTISRGDTLSLTQPETVNRQCAVQFQVFPDPNLKILGFANNVRLTEATDDKGNSLLIPNVNYNDSMNTMYGRQIYVYFSANLLIPPANAGSRISSLKGSLRVAVQTGSQPIEFSDLLSGKEITKTVPGYTITVKEVKKLEPQQQVQVRLAIASEKAGTSSNDPISNALQSVQLFDDRGHLFVSYNSGGRSSAQRWETTLTFGRDNSRSADDKLPDPARLVLDVPTGNKEIAVPVEFKDVPLP